ncbi:MAG TPA: ATP-dependent DNA helicase, partial [Synergistaceae bacterium]|nr:ATP-dependent DNA helicase [Synergistaceae bacterium]
GIPLQEQLIHKDLPALESVLGLGLTYGLLKGRGNYVCLLRAEETTGASGTESGYLSYGDGGAASRQVEAWVRRTTTG